MDNTSNVIELPMPMINRSPFEPYCIVWCSLPWLSYFIPTIGHMAITDSCGNIWDFSEPYFVSKNNFTFGPPIKFLRLDPKRVDRCHWDEGIKRAANIYHHKLVIDSLID